MPDNTTESELQKQLDVARETNRKLNRINQKFERRLNRWGSKQYTVMRIKRWYKHFYVDERKKTQRLEAEVSQLKSQLEMCRPTSLLNKLKKNYISQLTFLKSKLECKE